MSRPRLTLTPAVLLAALAALLVFAGVAAAETVTGESTALALSEGTSTPETTLVKSVGSYDSTAGTLTFGITTAAEPQAELEGEPSPNEVEVLVFKPTSACTIATISGTSGEFGGTSVIAGLIDEYSKPTALGLYLNKTSSSYEELPVTKSVAGTTTTLSSTSSYLVNQGFDCALVVLSGETPATEAESEDIMLFPLTPPPVVVTPAPTPPAPTPAPAAFSLKTPKPVQLKAGKWKIVKVKVTNTGATQSAAGTLQVKASKGVVVRPAKQQLPILTPGGSFTLSVRVKLTAGAKKTSKLSFSGTATGATGVTGSVLLKLKQ